MEAMIAPAPTLIPFLIAIPLIGWRLYSRVRRSIGRQPLSKVRPWVTLAIFPTIILLLGLAARGSGANLALLLTGIGAGTAVGMFGLSKTRFENTPQGMFYTPNAHLGIALSALFTARVVYRMVQMYQMDPAAQPHPGDFANSPLTLAIFGLLAGYYCAYAVGLIRWRRSQLPAAPSPD
jgi:cytochrome b561